MPSEQRVKEVSALYVTIFGEEPTLTQLEQYLGFSESVKTELISSLMMANSGLVNTYNNMSSEAKVKDMFKKLFGYSDAEMNAIIAQQAEVAANGGTDGFQYWVNELENNSAMINSNTLAIAFLNGADTQSYARAMNVAEVSSVINSYANTNSMSINIEEYTGQSDIDDLVLGYGSNSDTTSNTQDLVFTNEMLEGKTLWTVAFEENTKFLADFSLENGNFVIASENYSYPYEITAEGILKVNEGTNYQYYKIIELSDTKISLVQGENIDEVLASDAPTQWFFNTQADAQTFYDSLEIDNSSNSETITDNSTLDLGLATPVYMVLNEYYDSNADGVVDYTNNYTYEFFDGYLHEYQNGQYETGKYKFDANGNILEEYAYDAYDGSLLMSYTYTYNDANQILTSNNYDSEDNTTVVMTNTWSADGVVSNATFTYMGMSFNMQGIGTGLNSTKTDPLKWEVYFDGELDSVDYYTYDEFGNELEDREDEDADGVIDIIYSYDYILI